MIKLVMSRLLEPQFVISERRPGRHLIDIPGASFDFFPLPAGGMYTRPVSCLERRFIRKAWILYPQSRSKVLLLDSEPAWQELLRHSSNGSIDWPSLVERYRVDGILFKYITAESGHQGGISLPFVWWARWCFDRVERASRWEERHRAVGVEA